MGTDKDTAANKRRKGDFSIWYFDRKDDNGDDGTEVRLVRIGGTGDDVVSCHEPLTGCDVSLLHCIRRVYHVANVLAHEARGKWGSAAPSRKAILAAMMVESPQSWQRVEGALACHVGGTVTESHEQDGVRYIDKVDIDHCVVCLADGQELRFVLDTTGRQALSPFAPLRIPAEGHLPLSDADSASPVCCPRCLHPASRPWLPGSQSYLCASCGFGWDAARPATGATKHCGWCAFTGTADCTRFGASPYRQVPWHTACDHFQQATAPQRSSSRRPETATRADRDASALDWACRVLEGQATPEHDAAAWKASALASVRENEDSPIQAIDTPFVATAVEGRIMLEDPSGSRGFLSGATDDARELLAQRFAPHRPVADSVRCGGAEGH